MQGPVAREARSKGIETVTLSSGLGDTSWPRRREMTTDRGKNRAQHIDFLRANGETHAIAVL
jgi:hypothetical protein